MAFAAVLLHHYLKRRELARQQLKVADQKTICDGSALPPGLTITGLKAFTYKELAKATDDFSASCELGEGGYGRVYKGILADGSQVAIKRSRAAMLFKEATMHRNNVQFYNEIELLSRVHHRNLVLLLGYCHDQGEQMLVYEFMASGTIRDHLNPNEILDFSKRLHIALGTARGILYLHTGSNPPIFHRDIKASNILLDNNFNAKVADFGLSKLVTPTLDDDLQYDSTTTHYVSTRVMGTPGYLDPEYYMTQKLTDKTDVYSFGVVLLELITGRVPISKSNKNIVREVIQAMEEEQDIASIVDPQMGTINYPSEEVLKSFLQLALACCHSDTSARPSMDDIVRELEDLRQTCTRSGKSGSSWKTYSSMVSMDFQTFLVGTGKPLALVASSQSIGSGASSSSSSFDPDSIFSTPPNLSRPIPECHVDSVT